MFMVFLLSFGQESINRLVVDVCSPGMEAPSSEKRAASDEFEFHPLPPPASFPMIQIFIRVEFQIGIIGDWVKN
jgi:hypothetical protein